MFFETKPISEGMIVFSAPLSGMTQAENTVNQVAQRLATPTGDSVDLSTEAVSLMVARDNFAIDAKLAETEDQMSQAALSVFA
jgi:flagellar hook protein FlgE